MLLSILDIGGLIAFAISGSLAAMEKKLDFFGIFIIAIVTSVGGGTLRDLLLGNVPIFWLNDDINTMYLIVTTSIFTITFRNKLTYLRKSIFLFDTVGIGVFTLVGLQIGLSHNLLPFSCILLGTISACFGGVARDILCNKLPVIFHKEIYALACILGGCAYFAFSYLNLSSDVLSLICVSTVIFTRLLAVKYQLSLPFIYKGNQE